MTRCETAIVYNPILLRERNLFIVRCLSVLLAARIGLLMSKCSHPPIERRELTSFPRYPIEIGCTDPRPFGDASLLLNKPQSVESLLIGEDNKEIVLL